MGRKRKSRQSSGNDSGKESESKLFKSRGPSGGEASDQIQISDLLNETNEVLYGDKSGKADIDIVLEERCSGFGSSMSQTAVKQTQGGPTNSDLMALLEKINGRICSVEKRLDSLSVLERKVDSFDKDLKKMWMVMEDRLKKTEERMSFVENRTESIDFSVAELSSKIDELEREKNSLKDDVVYLTSQSMRNNLLFTNIPEADDEEPKVTEEKLRVHLVDKLKLAQETVNRIGFERVHRTGGKREGRIRHVVAKFVLFKDRELVRKSWKALEGTNFQIFEQFPKEVIEKRKKLLPKMKEHRRKGDRAWLVYDTLYVNGRPLRD